MSNFRDKAREVRARGVEERGNFNPSGTPLKLYKYWLSRSQSNRAYKVRMGDQKENFCHFWRVVAIWAPLMLLTRKVKSLFENPLFVLAIGLLVIAAVVYGVMTSENFAQLLIIVAIAAVSILSTSVGLISSVSLLYYDSDAQRRLSDMPTAKWSKIGMALGPVGTLIGLSAYGADKFHKRFIRGNGDKISLALFVIVALAFYGGVALVEGWGALLISLAATVGLLLAVIAVVYVLLSIADYISGRRALAREAEEEAIENWIHGDGPYPFANAKRKPSKVSKFFTAVGDFLVLTFQVVRVKKWKICPMVEIKK